MRCVDAGRFAPENQKCRALTSGVAALRGDDDRKRRECPAGVTYPQLTRVLASAQRKEEKRLNKRGDLTPHGRPPHMSAKTRVAQNDYALFYKVVERRRDREEPQSSPNFG